eukprot:Em0129g1a
MKRNKKKLLLLAVATAGAYVGGRYLMRRVSQISDRQTVAQRQVWRLKEHFESNRKTCNSTVISLLPTLKDALHAQLNAEAITAELRTRPSNKLSLWENLKTISFARVVVGVVSCSMLVAYMRVQLSILGATMFRDLHRPPGEEPGAPPDVQKKFLSYVQYFLQDGVVGVASCTRKATEEVLADLSLKHQMTSQDMVQLVTQVGTRMAANAPGGGGGGGSLGSCIRQYLTPREPLLQLEGEEEGEGSGDSSCVAYMLSATRDVLDCAQNRSNRMLDMVILWDSVAFIVNDFATVLDGLINQGFAELHKGLCDVYHSAAQA